MPDSKACTLELINLSKAYAATKVLDNINLAVKDGEFVTIRGKSGTGKTTLLKIVGLLESPDKGEVRLFGKSTCELTDDLKSKIRLHNVGFVFQSFNLIPSLTVLENIELPLALAGRKKQERKQRAHDLLKYFDLTHLTARFPQGLSGGEKQRVAIIRALANSPRIILADEPTSSLDDSNSSLVIELLTNVCKERKVVTILTTTDLQEEVPASKEYMLRSGQLHEKSPFEIFASNASISPFTPFDPKNCENA